MAEDGATVAEVGETSRSRETRVIGRVVQLSGDSLTSAPVSLVGIPVTPEEGWKLADQPSLDASISDADGHFALRVGALPPATRALGVVVWGCAATDDHDVLRTRAVLTAVTIPVPSAGSTEAVALCVPRRAATCEDGHAAVKDRRAAAVRARRREDEIRVAIRRALPRSAVSRSSVRRRPGDVTVPLGGDPGPAMDVVARAGVEAVVRALRANPPRLRMSQGDLRALGVDPDEPQGSRVDLDACRPSSTAGTRPGSAGRFETRPTSIRCSPGSRPLCRDRWGRRAMPEPDPEVVEAVRRLLASISPPSPGARDVLTFDGLNEREALDNPAIVDMHMLHLAYDPVYQDFAGALGYDLAVETLLQYHKMAYGPDSDWESPAEELPNTPDELDLLLAQMVGAPPPQLEVDRLVSRIFPVVDSDFWSWLDEPRREQVLDWAEMVDEADGRRRTTLSSAHRRVIERWHEEFELADGQTPKYLGSFGWSELKRSIHELRQLRRRRLRLRHPCRRGATPTAWSSPCARSGSQRRSRWGRSPPPFP